ncbi:BTAD domain-containing putative transcriptional regulator [Catellatospora sp. IY07-71]|uniref:AfsR/SARP family transcriptional regulator n=1 Tax=Catellatospora sp. IY07-71 TaxID=2728827 RepID=UPI001BB3AAA6|nr:BTAD domain-containing putative transcriptional regulator [Catellatospora sp. IY07-71]
MNFGVLGALRVRAGERDVAIGSRTQRLLLTALIARAGSVVPADGLVEIIWGDAASASALPSLYTYVSRLRGLLRSGGEDVLLTHPPGYLLQITPEQTDAGRFEQLCDQARRIAAADPEHALTSLDEALALWRGPAYAEFADEEFARPEATRLTELRLTAIEQRFDAGLALGRHAGLVGAIDAHAAANPLRERPREQHMLALYRCGRQAEALAVFRAFRTRLDEELGVEPTATLRALEAAVLRQDPALDWTPPAASPLLGGGYDTEVVAASADIPGPPPSDRETAGGGPAVPGAAAVPVEMSSFVGRETDLAAVGAQLRECRLVTLTGPGGVGKTRLATHVAMELSGGYADGVRWCELAPVTDGDALGHALAAAVGARQQPGLGIEESALAYLAARELLLVLDNCEHVLAEAAQLTAAVVRACPRVTVLATSRTGLGVPGERLHPVAPLPVPETGAAEVTASPAVRLFVDRARAVRPGLDLTGDNLAHIAEVCRQLDGLPLAIELAAARIRSLNPADVADRLADGLRLLSTTRPTATARHRTLRAVVDWSYALLGPAEQHLFDRLSVFTGGFTLDAAERVCAETDLLDALAVLVDGSLVTAGPSAGQVRYSMLSLLRAYGREKLAERGELPQVHDAHAAYYATAAQDVGERIRGTEEGACVALLDAELGNLRAAHRWAVDRHDTDVAMRISAGLYHYVVYRFHDEVVSWGETVLGLPDAQRHPLHPVVCGAVAEGLTLRGDQRRALSIAEQALRTAPDPDGPLCLPVRKVLAAVALYEGRLDDCFRWASEQTRLARLHGDAWREGEGLLFQGLARTYAGDPAGGLAIAREQLRVTRAIGNPTLLAWAMYSAAEALSGSDPAEARRLYTEAVALAWSVGGAFTATIAEVGLAALLTRSGQYAEAARAFRRCVDQWHRLQIRHHQWTTLRNLVQLLVRTGAHEDAAVLLGALGAADTAAYGADAADLTAAAKTLTAALGAAAYRVAADAGAALAPDETVAFALSALSRAGAGTGGYG